MIGLIEGLRRVATLVGLIPTTAMRGTDSAALATVASEARLAELDADDDETSVMGGEYSAATNKDFYETRLHAKKSLDANTALIIRSLNQSDNITAIFDAKAIYEN